MLLEQKSPLPFIDNFPLHVQIRIFPDNGGYMADINADWSNWYRFRIGIKPNDLQELNSELQQAIEDVSHKFEREGILSNSLLEQLAQKGSFAFKRIFSEDTPRETVSRALKMAATVQFSSEDFFIPWELLYDKPIGVQTDISGFWGMRHIISRALIRDIRPGDLVSPIIQATCPHIGLITYNDLTHVSEKEIPVFQEFQEQKRIFLFPLRPLNDNRRNEELEHLRQFLCDEDLQIVHFACHAVAEKSPSNSYLLISEEFPISIQDFVVRDFKIKHNSLVILNACLTGTTNPLHTSNWAALFWGRGARGVLATEFHVPDSFAASFIKELYDHLLSGMPIGEAVLTSRRHFWEEHHNPLGLAYALYSSPSIRVVSPDM